MSIVLFLHLENQWERWESFGSSFKKLFFKKERVEGDGRYYP